MTSSLYRQADRWSQRAAVEGYCSRAAYKLIEIQQRFQLARRDSLVLDLGSAPGSFLQAMAPWVAPSGALIGVDLSPLSPLVHNSISKARFAPRPSSSSSASSSSASPLRFYQQDVFNWPIERHVAPLSVALLTSDLMSSTTGLSEIDVQQSHALCLRALQMARYALEPGGHLVAKVFQGSSHNALLAEFERAFASVQCFKPAASRSNSRETFIVAKRRKRER